MSKQGTRDRVSPVPAAPAEAMLAHPASCPSLGSVESESFNETLTTLANLQMRERIHLHLALPQLHWIVIALTWARTNLTFPLRWTHVGLGGFHEHTPGQAQSGCPGEPSVGMEMLCVVNMHLLGT